MATAASSAFDLGLFLDRRRYITHSDAAQKAGFYPIGAFSALLAYWCATLEGDISKVGPASRAEALNEIGRSLIAQGDVGALSAAVMALNESLDLTSDDVCSREFRGSTLETLARYAMTAGALPNAEDCLRKAVTIDDPETTLLPAHCFALSYVLLRKQSPRKSYVLDQGLALTSNSLRGNVERLKADAFFCEAIHAYHRGDVTEALHLLDEADRLYCGAFGSYSMFYRALLHISEGVALLQQGERHGSRQEVETRAAAFITAGFIRLGKKSAVPYSLTTDAFAGSLKNRPSAIAPLCVTPSRPP